VRKRRYLLFSTRIHPFTTEMLSAEVPDFACFSVELSVQAGI